MRRTSKPAQRNDKPKRSRTAAAQRRAALRALRVESELHLRDQIRRLLALPMEERTHFLRVRLPGGGTTL